MSGKNKIRIIYMGTPAWAVEPLLSLVADERYEVVAVITRPPAPVGRGKKLTKSPVQVAAEDLKIEVNPSNVWNREVDVYVVVAYGKILTAKQLAQPKYGAVNLHYSLLPRWRGASPVQTALLAGDEVTGVSIQKMAEELDAGDVLVQKEEEIRSDDTTASLGERLTAVGSKLLPEVVAVYVAGEVIAKKQAEEEVTMARLIQKSDGLIYPAQKSALEIERMVRAFDPWPGVTMEYNSKMVKLKKVELAEIENKPGKIWDENGDVYLGCQEGVLRLLQVQPAGKREMIAADWWRGCVQNKKNEADKANLV